MKRSRNASQHSPRNVLRKIRGTEGRSARVSAAGLAGLLAGVVWAAPATVRGDAPLVPRAPGRPLPVTANWQQALGTGQPGGGTGQPGSGTGGPGSGAGARVPVGQELLGVSPGPAGLRIRPGWEGGGMVPQERGRAAAVLPAHLLAFQADMVQARASVATPAGSSVRLDVRGDRATDGVWTQWQPVAPDGKATFADPVTSVQVRLNMSRGRRGA